MLNNVLDILILAPLTACLSLFIAFCLREGNIFGAYGSWIDKKSEESKTLEYILKPIGGCVYCFGTWVFIGVFFCFNSLNINALTIIICILGSGLNYVLINLIAKIDEL